MPGIAVTDRPVGMSPQHVFIAHHQGVAVECLGHVAHGNLRQGINFSRIIRFKKDSRNREKRLFRDFAGDFPHPVVDDCHLAPIAGSIIGPIQVAGKKISGHTGGISDAVVIVIAVDIPVGILAVDAAHPAAPLAEAGAGRLPPDAAGQGIIAGFKFGCCLPDFPARPAPGLDRY